MQTLVLEESSDRQLVVASILEELGQDHRKSMNCLTKSIQPIKLFGKVQSTSSSVAHKSEGLPIRLRILEDATKTFPQDLVLCLHA